jgi:DNA repair photolyase
MQKYTEAFGFKSIFYFCPLPIRFDSYSGCSQGCLYCWSQWCGHKKRYITNGLRPIDINDLRSRLRFAIDARIRKKSVINQLLENNCPIHFGGLSEPLQSADKKYHVSYKAIELFRNFDYPILISTKGKLLGDRAYLDLIESHKRCAIQVSFSTLDDDLGARIEPGAPLPSQRIDMIKEISKRGIWVAVRLQPFLFPIHSVNDYNLDLLSKIGVKHVIVEHLRIPTNFDKEALVRLYDVLGMDILDYYKRNGLQINRVNYELSVDVKIPNIIEFRNRAHKVGLTFGCGDNDLHHLSDDDCCCGIQCLDGFNKIYKGSFLTAIMACDSKGRINLDNIRRAWQPSGSIREHLNSDCRGSNFSKPIEYLEYKWNNPGLSDSLTRFYGVECIQSDFGYSYQLTKKCLRLINRT